MEIYPISERFAKLLIKEGKLSPKDSERLLRHEQQSSRPFTQLLMEENILVESELTRLLSDYLHLPVFQLSAYQLESELIKLLPRQMAQQYQAVPLSKVGSILTLAICRPLDLVSLDNLESITGCRIRPVLVTFSELQNALASHYTDSHVIDDVLKEADEQQVEVIGQREVESENSVEVDGAPVVRLVNQIIQEAVQMRASDIHLEPYRDHFRIRFRIDGILKETFRHSMGAFNAVMARIKILSSLDITERRVPQDGRFKIKLTTKEIDFRVSSLPTFFGEKGVLRLLDKTNVCGGLDDLGFSEKPIQLFKEAIRRPYGMILVTGPTGSGKSTTLYSVLNLLNTPQRNLMTVEDPIEYQIEGITQTQVNPEIGLTFVSGLRSLLRQSPDVILVGEIRDSETADIAVKASLTGHLVLSTLHTNSAAGAVTRLIDMGVEPFLIASSVIIVAGQRLLRKICPYCKEPAPILEEVRKRMGDLMKAGEEKMSFRGKGCKRCNQTGYKGRLGAIEVLPIDSEIREAILSRASSEEIESMARKKGMETLNENAFQLFKSGKTTLEEVLRVTAIASE